MSSPYNGYSPEERQASCPVQARARKAGVLAPDPEVGCEMCGRKYGYLCPHLEDYDRCVSDAHHLCVFCHMTLHCRFWRPNTWLRLVWHLTYEKGYEPPYYKHGGQYFSNIKKRPDHDFEDRVLDEHKVHWWQYLRMEEIDFRALKAAGDPHVKDITHPENPEIDLVYNLTDGYDVPTESPAYLKKKLKEEQEKLQRQFDWGDLGH